MTKLRLLFGFPFYFLSFFFRLKPLLPVSPMKPKIIRFTKLFGPAVMSKFTKSKFKSSHATFAQ